MLELKTTSKFRKDYKSAKNRNLDMSILEEVIDTLLSGASLDRKYKDHELTGRYRGLRECHLMPDWLLVYSVNSNTLILTLIRTGTHSDLF